MDITGVVERTIPSGGVGSKYPFAGQIWNDRSNIAKLVWARQAALSGQMYDLGVFANMSPDLTMVSWNTSWMPDRVLDVSRATDLDEDHDPATVELCRCGANGVWDAGKCEGSNFGGSTALRNATATCDTNDYCADPSDHAILWAHQTFVSTGFSTCNDGNTNEGDGCSKLGFVEATGSANVSWLCATNGTRCKLQVLVPYSGTASNQFEDVTESTAPTDSDAVTIPSTVNCTVATTSFEIRLLSDPVWGTPGSGCNDGKTTTNCYENYVGAASTVGWGYRFNERQTSGTKLYQFKAPKITSTTASLGSIYRFGTAFSTGTLATFPSSLTTVCTAYPYGPGDSTPPDPTLGYCETLADGSRVYSPQSKWTRTIDNGTAASVTTDPLTGKQLKNGFLQFWFNESYADGPTDWLTAAMRAVDKQGRFVLTCK